VTPEAQNVIALGFLIFCVLGGLAMVIWAIKTKRY
jgi:hypothetical protein